MPKNAESINSNLFDLLQTHGYAPTMLSTAGKEIPVPEEADVFQFTFKKDGEDYGTVTISIDGLHKLVVYSGDDVANSPGEESHGDQQDTSWYTLLGYLKRFAQQHQLSFEIRNTDHLKYDMAKRTHMKKVDESKDKIKHDAIVQSKGKHSPGGALPESFDDTVYPKRSEHDKWEANRVAKSVERYKNKGHDDQFAYHKKLKNKDEPKKVEESFGAPRDQFKRDFKRQEMEHELGHEDRAMASGPWFLRIDGRIWNKNGQPVSFRDWRSAERSAASIRGRNPGKRVTPTQDSSAKIAESYYATGKKSSYSDNVPAVKIVIQHSRALEEGERRYRAVEKIFVENAQGERFALPTNKPGLARVYARHIAEGGTPYDEQGKHINELCEEYNKMAGFVRATRTKQFNESTQTLVNEGVAHYQKLRETLGKMQGHRGYQAYFESWTPTLTEDADDTTDLSEMFASSELDPRIESAMPILRKLSKTVTEMSEVSELDSWADDIIEESFGDVGETTGYGDARDADHSFSGTADYEYTRSPTKASPWVLKLNGKVISKSSNISVVKAAKEKYGGTISREREVEMAESGETPSQHCKSCYGGGLIRGDQKCPACNGTGVPTGGTQQWGQTSTEKPKEDDMMDEGRMVKGVGGVPLDRRGNPIPPKPAKVPSLRQPPKERMSLDRIWMKVEDVVSQIFPDGDPIDWLWPWCQKHGVDYKEVDRAARKHGYQDVYDYYEQMKQDHAADMESDADSEFSDAAYKDRQVDESTGGAPVRISIGSRNQFEDWMESEGYDTDVPKRNEGGYIVYDFSQADPGAQLYAQQWDEEDMNESEFDARTIQKQNHDDSSTKKAFRVSMINPDGKQVSGTVQAYSEQKARDFLAAKGYQVKSIRPYGVNEGENDGQTALNPQGIPESIDYDDLQKAHDLLNRSGDADMSHEEVVQLLTDNGFSEEVACHVADDSGRSPSMNESDQTLARMMRIINR